MTHAPEPLRRTIPLAKPDVGPRELELVTEVLRGDVLAIGPFTQRFEEGIVAVAGRREGVACSSGTAGLHLGVRALEIDRLLGILPPFPRASFRRGGQLRGAHIP